MGGSRRGESRGSCAFLIVDMEDKDILDIMDGIFYPKEDTLKFCVDIFIRSISGMGGQEGGRWRTLRVLDWRLGGCGLS